MHAKTDSEVTSIAPSSPTRSPARRPAYYVQSPSRDSHDGEKTTTASFHSTPVLSPSGSPPHSHSSVGRHSRESSTSRFSGSLKPGSRKVSPNDPASARSGRRKSGAGDKPWKQCDAIEEEGLLDGDEDQHRPLIPRCCYFPLFVVAFFVLFSFFALILFAASRSQKPHIVVKSITFESFNIQAGTDASGVPTDMATLNSTLKMTYRNTGSFFGVHVSSTSLDLAFTQLTLASGNMNEFYQGRKSQRNVNVVVVGNRIPLYGGGASLSATPATGGKGGATANPPVPLTLSFTVRSRAYVLGKLVKPKFYTNIQCSMVMDQSKLNTPVSLANSCQYN